MHAIFLGETTVRHTSQILLTLPVPGIVKHIVQELLLGTGMFTPHNRIDKPLEKFSAMLQSIWWPSTTVCVPKIVHMLVCVSFANFNSRHADVGTSRLLAHSRLISGEIWQQFYQYFSSVLGNLMVRFWTQTLPNRGNPQRLDVPSLVRKIYWKLDDNSSVNGKLGGPPRALKICLWTGTTAHIMTTS